MGPLYHYTTAAGLKGIIDTKTYWASDYRFLNDTSEFKFGFSILTTEIRRYKSDLQDVSVEAWHSLSSLLESVERSGVVGLVASFTTQGDLLSQWRGYNTGKGYALGINADWLTQNADAQGFALFPIAYDREIQYKSANAALTLLMTMLKAADNQPGKVTDVIKSWWKHALKVALAFKNKHFSEEQEYRLAYIGQSWPAGIQVRTSPTGLIPYLPCKFDEKIIDNPVFHPKNLGLEHIIVGPALKDQQSAAVDALLASHQMRFAVSKSAIPYTAD